MPVSVDDELDTDPEPVSYTHLLIVKFSEPITALDGIFDDTGAWGTDTLKGWIDDYESRCV